MAPLDGGCPRQRRLWIQLLSLALASPAQPCSSASSWKAATPLAFIAPSAFLIVFGGTAGAMIASSGLKAFLQMPKLFLVSMKYKGAMIDKVAAIRTIVGMAEKARREGLLSLEEETQNARPTRSCGRGSRWSSTAPTPSSSRTSSSPTWMPWRPATAGRPACTRRWAASRRRSASSAPSWASCTCSRTCPTRERSGRRSRARSSRRSTASSSANLVFLPIGNKLKRISHDEVHARTMLIEGVDLDPGRRQPARRRGEAPHVPRPVRARRPLG